MLKSCLITVVLFLFFSCNKTSQPSYFQIIQSKRDFIKISFKGPNSPLQEKDRDSFNGLSYYDIDSNFRIIAKLKWNSNVKPVRLIKDTTIASFYYPSAEISFSIDEKQLKLTGYIPSLDKKNEIFIPFYDLTSGGETYSGGRFLEVSVKDTNTVTLDFNLAYNPYCVYNPRYICAVPPFANDLKVYIFAGEKITSFLKN